MSRWIVLPECSSSDTFRNFPPGVPTLNLRARRIDAETAGAAEQRLLALELVDEMVDGGMRRGDALKTISLARSTYCDWRKAFRRGGAAGRTSTPMPCSGCAASTRSWARSGSRPCSTGAASDCPSPPSGASGPLPSARAGPSPSADGPSTAPRRSAGSTTRRPRPPASWSTHFSARGPL